MSRFVDNVNIYLENMEIKQAFIALKTGMDSSRISRILTKTQDITGTDMEKIANALGHKAEFFMSDNFVVTDAKNYGTEIAFYAGKPGNEQWQFASKLMELADSMDVVLGAETRIMAADYTDNSLAL